MTACGLRWRIVEFGLVRPTGESKFMPEERDMNVLLIYPETPSGFWSFEHALRFVRKRATAPPLGLPTVAALLPPDWNKRIVDLNVSSLTATDLEWADLAFVSGMIVQRESAAAVVDRCHEAGLRVVAGGPLFSEDRNSFPGVDHFVLGEAEVTLPPFLRDLQTGVAKRLYETKAFADLRLSPTPAWNLVPFGPYASMPIQYSRGCPYDCEFCSVTALFGHRPRTKSAAQIVVELEALHSLGWRDRVFFVDDNLIGNRRDLKQELLPALIEMRKRGLRMTFHTEASINLADDPELMAMMVAAGFDMVFIGIETPNEDSLSECGKKNNMKRDLVASVHRIQRAGLQVQGGFIVGFDHDTSTIFRRQIDFIQKSGITTAMVGLLQAPRGTRLYKRLMVEGRIRGDSTGDNVDGTTNVVSLMDPQELRRGYQEILAGIYTPKHYYERVRTFLREYRPGPTRPRMDVAQFGAFFRSLYRLGIRGKERNEFWKLLVWTQFRHPKLMPLAVTLAIHGYHFRKVCELHVALATSAS